MNTNRPDPYPSRTTDRCTLTERLDPVVYPGFAAAGEPLTETQVAEYAHNGFLALSSWLESDVVTEVLAAAHALREAHHGDARPEVILEPESEVVRSIFDVHKLNAALRSLCQSTRLAGVARQLLGGEVYVHQARINFKPAFRGKEFYWHSDFETWHVEDGMPRMRALSCSVALSENNEHNGPLMLVPRSHERFVACAGKTPKDHYKQSLRKQEYGVPSDEALATLVERGGIEAPKGPAGSVTFFDCNTMHGSASNISPYPRTNVFFVFNSVENTLEAPFGEGLDPRPELIAARDFTPVAAL